MTPRTIPVEVFDLIVFGATGDLAQRKLLPALFHRDVQGQIPLCGPYYRLFPPRHDP